MLQECSTDAVRYLHILRACHPLVALLCPTAWHRSALSCAWSVIGVSLANTCSRTPRTWAERSKVQQ
ncbi:hypothetical protein OEZ86_009779 [Tetradesmus obliquus]|uniref:Uncharacterized protein n=1 Tax=Tetradesmus obliquus TaxID=3088 RepID=A0ABY8UNG9_TETOB|nr:hypothetical protein OEZ85_001221 [Tetradesmus obliquus]WIA43277.1 hypothetical protein OEZ86_009779 [Tetradesmus obliquus]